jgi:predicted RNase H-like HicB family nuclease
MSAKSFADKLKRDSEAPELAKIEWDAEKDNYHVTLWNQPTVVATIETLEELARRIEFVLDEAAK